jgi:hypothetical protein
MGQPLRSLNAYLGHYPVISSDPYIGHITPHHLCAIQTHTQALALTLASLSALRNLTETSLIPAQILQYIGLFFAF